MDLLNRLTRYRLAHARKPAGRFGKLLISAMNLSHIRLTHWGLNHVTVRDEVTVLDVGCGGGGAMRALAKRARHGIVLGVDPSGASVVVSRSVLGPALRKGRALVAQGGVSALPFADHIVDLAIAVNTHLYWPDLVGDLGEIRRVLKPEGVLAIVSSVGQGRKNAERDRKYAEILGLAFPDTEALRAQFVAAGYTSVEVYVDTRKGWLCVTGTNSQPEHTRD